MTTTPPDLPAWIAETVARQRAGHGLDGVFYRDETIHRLDVERIWRRSWLFAGHACEAPAPGDYFVVDVEDDSIVVIRGDDGRINAFHNVCRHRGSRLLDVERGRAGKIVCPYHQWVYGRDGRLMSCRGMHEGIDRSQLGLVPAPVVDFEGLVFVSLAEEPPDIEAAREALAPMIRPQGLARARVARSIDYDVRANWKIVWENNRECYHCNVNHPEYIRANFDHYNTDDTTDSVRGAIDEATRRSTARWRERGLDVTHRRAGMATFPEGDCWFAVNRTPLVEGWVTESLDGRRVGPLMGDYDDADVGTLRVRTLPNMWNHSSCDHGVTTRLLPAGPRHTRVRVTWLVDADAVEGKDYDLERLLPFWQRTSEQDWELCERVQRGVLSSAYRPGPFSTHKEYNVDGFVRWYLRRLAGPEAPGGTG